VGDTGIEVLAEDGFASACLRALVVVDKTSFDMHVYGHCGVRSYAMDGKITS
jgi:hypothetical protein